MAGSSPLPATQMSPDVPGRAKSPVENHCFRVDGTGKVKSKKKRWYMYIYTYIYETFEESRVSFNGHILIFVCCVYFILLVYFLDSPIKGA